MRILFIGDVVGSVGREALRKRLPALKAKHRPDFIVVNGENAAHGRGITKPIATSFFEWGIHGITMGNHTWDQREIYEFIDDEPRLIRPANFPDNNPGAGWAILKAGSKEMAIISLQGRTFLPPSSDCPFRKADEILEQLEGRNIPILVDFHAEATSEKIAMGWYLDGRVSAVVGTHTHVQSHDDRVLPEGTAYVTDVGMTGPLNGILGMEKEAVISKFLSGMPVRFVVDEGKWQLNGALIETDDATNQAKAVRLIREDEDRTIIE